MVKVGLAALVVSLALACQNDGRSSGSSVPAGEHSPTGSQDRVVAPTHCVSSVEATRTTIAGEPTWARFCPGPDGRTAPAEVPSDALTTHLYLLEHWDEFIGAPDSDDRCRADFNRSYRLQIGYPDGQVAQVSGSTGPTCVGSILASGSSVRGPADFGVYGAAMAAFGRQYSDGFEPAASDTPLDCPIDPREPDSVDRDGPAAALETGYHLGRPEAMTMPLTGIRGIVCTWPHGGGDEPTIRQLTPEDAERVRIGMHAIHNAMVDCEENPDPTYVAVVEDKTGTRRAVTILESECSTVIRSDAGFGLGFPWLER